MKKKFEIGDYVVARDISVLLDGVKTDKTPYGRQFIVQKLNSLIELSNLILITISKVGPLKWEVNEIITEDNSTVADEGEITFTSDWYDIRRFSNAKEATYYNALLGEQTEYRVQ